MSLSSLEGIFLAVGALAQQPMYCRRELWERVSHRATRQRAPHGARVQGRARRSGSWGGGSGVAELRVRAKLRRGARCAAPARIGARERRITAASRGISRARHLMRVLQAARCSRGKEPN